MTSVGGNGQKRFDIEKTVDVVIVGGGPGGALAAREFARGGVKTLVVDRRQEIGAPKRCAEGISNDGLLESGVQPHPAWTSGRITGAVLYSPSGKIVTVDDETAVGWVVERKVFEKHLGKDAIEAGAQYMVKTHIDQVLMDGARAVGVTGDFMGKSVKINAKLVVGADGIDSLIGRKAGLRGSVQKMRDFHSAAQYEMAGVKCDMTRLHLYFGGDVAPLGYVWIFPKAAGLANVGVGILTSKSKHGHRAIDYLDRFIAKHPEMFEKASPLEVNASGIPVSAGIRRFWGDGLMLVGDAAQQVNPIHGGGISLAMRAGVIAGQVGSKAIKEGDVSAERLSEYGRVWDEVHGKELARLYKFRMFMEELTDKDMERMADLVTIDVIVDLTYARFRSFAKLMLTKMPTMVPLLAKYLMAPGKKFEMEALEA
ncbi:MAG: NAD(P)/FAD-dependent oxidoreductase [Euryarchaeota archaeon]|nr:NAD(P)/FAD-dependent oxidoreductase [Euryarchaeota archaeon]